MKGVSLGLKLTPTASAAAGYGTLHLPQVWYPPIPHPNEEGPHRLLEQSIPGWRQRSAPRGPGSHLCHSGENPPLEEHTNCPLRGDTALSRTSYPNFFSSLLKRHAQKSSLSEGSNASQTSTASLCVPRKGRGARVPSRGFPGGSRVKSLPAMQEMWVRSLGQEDLLQKEMAIPSSILACRIAWTEEAGGLQSSGAQSLTRP